MILIVGLGNPGKKYARTRHNAGFMIADKLREAWNFPEFKLNKKFNSKISKKKLEIATALAGSPAKRDGRNCHRLGGVPTWQEKLEILLIKPQTFMNLSGQAVKKIMKFYKIKPEDIIVIHDDLDVDLGKFKISADSRAAGHNGAQSIIDSLGTKNFTRVRIGIEGAAKRKTRKIPGDQYVLKNFTSSEIKTIQKISGEIISSIKNLIR